MTPEIPGSMMVRRIPDFKYKGNPQDIQLFPQHDLKYHIINGDGYYRGMKNITNIQVLPSGKKLQKIFN